MLRLTPGELGDEPRCRELGKAAGEQVVARVAARDVDHLAAKAEVVDVLTEDDLHGSAVAPVAAVAAVAAPPPSRSSRPSAT